MSGKEGIDRIFDRHILSYAADLRNTTINASDVRCADRLKVFDVLEKSSGDDGRKSGKFRKLDGRKIWQGSSLRRTKC